MIDIVEEVLGMKKEKTEDMVVEMDIGKIQLSGTNPRISLDKDKLKKFAYSIERAGVHLPLIVRKKGKGHELVAGERRLKAAKIAGLKTVPVIVKVLTDIEALVVQMEENKHREDPSPLEDARGYKQLEEAGWTQEQIGERFGLSQGQVSNRIRLLNLPEKLHGIISRGIITPGHAKELLRLKTKKEQLAIAKELTSWNRRPSVRDTELAVENALEDAEKKERFRKVLKDAKFKKCPKDGNKAVRLDTHNFKKRDVLTCCYHSAETGHRWDPETGKVVLTGWEKQAEKERKQKAKEAAERRKERGPTDKHVPTMPAWVFSLATVQQWAQALLEHGADDIDALEFSDDGLFVLVGGDHRIIGNRHTTIKPVKVPDGSGDYHTVVTIDGYRSTPSQDDNVARGKEEVAEVKKMVRKILSFQKKNIGIGQTLKDSMLKEVDGFKLGGKVKIAKEFSIKSYQGAGAEIVGFTKNRLAVLNYSKPRKVIQIEDLEVVEKKTVTVDTVLAKVKELGEGMEKVHCDTCDCDNVPTKGKDGSLFCGACDALIEVAS